MNFSEIVRQSIESLLRNRLRSGLTMLGIIWGLVTVVLLLSYGKSLGEGVLNGLLTARLGLAAIDVTRPLPFAALPRPALGDLAKDLLRKRDGDE